MIDDTALPKKGTHSVGVGPQYAGALGKKANCQSLVSLTLAKDEVPIPIVLRLFLPDTWIKDPERMQHAGVPETFRVERSKPEIALAELQRVMQAGVSFGAVLADAGYGISAPFRQALSALGLLWAVGIPRIQKVYPCRCAVSPATRHAWRAAQDARTGSRSLLRPKPMLAKASLADGSSGDAAPRGRCGRISRPCACGWPMGRRCVCRDGPASICPARRSGWWASIASSGERKYYLSNLPPDTAAEAAGFAHQGALGVRAGASATQGRTRSRSLRGPLLARAAPTCADDADRLSVPAAPAFAGRQGGKKEKPADHRHNRPCRPFGAGCLIIWHMPCACDVPSAGPTSPSTQ